MTGEATFYGVYVPWLLVLAVVAWGLCWGARRLLGALGVYRWVWHAALFDTALYVLILFLLSRLTAAQGFLS
ncbi:MAG: DUF1656 domain-containing protein [Gammaproteobacteria bacterium]|uniref:Uncharacterized protein DUF1656 n=1 Tax=Pseudacidovorax intermedius TaxID=433924 RepID=A0A370FDA3_9BURK|nr:MULTISPECIES: DUF1656 domain-containing protein [Pseudacidovorax]MBO9643421.1 DUF1656 domain-containing protein [Pseudacidovorax sp.]MBP6895521.1 DUF1656 domain-containing protein [Pseudacidovorax sp.]RDI22710.1 uncharacterized protein DUF1656 [Pseudacidovorax intermedius]